MAECECGYGDTQFEHRAWCFHGKHPRQSTLAGIPERKKATMDEDVLPALERLYQVYSAYACCMEPLPVELEQPLTELMDAWDRMLG